MSQTLANRDQKFWAEMRQNIHLIYRSDTMDFGDKRNTVDAVRSELSDILEKRIITYPPTLLRLGVDHYLTFEQRKKALGVLIRQPSYTENEEKFLKSMEIKADNARKANWKWRIATEAEQLQAEGWYPFFVTLTVDPNAADPRELWQKGREFRKYIRKIAKISARVVGHPPPHKKTKHFDYRPESDYVKYVGVIEHGKSREHHHGHFLIWMKNIPSHWKIDPNEGRLPHRRTIQECKPARRYWKWSKPGLSKFNYFRTKSDIWSQNGFTVPVKEDGKEFSLLPAASAGRYLAKYMAKDFKEWKHRVKATRNLGMTRLKKLIQELPPKVTEALTWRPENSNTLHSVSLIHGAPLALVRFAAKQMNYYHNWSMKQLDLTKQLKSNSGIFQRMLHSVRRGHRPDRMPSLDFYDWVGDHLPAENEYCEKRLIDAHEKLREHFPRVKTLARPKHIEGNSIGLASGF